MQYKYIIKHYSNNILTVIQKQFAIIFLTSLLFFSQSPIFAISGSHMARLDKINQQVSVRDLVVRTEYPHCYGESEKHTNSYHYPENERIIDYIQLLFSIANEDHKANYYVQDTNGEFQLQDDKKNCITRLTMNEFSLYTKKPLSANEFNNILSKISMLACNLRQNVHVLLSSFAVRAENERILNICVFIEGGNIPKIHIFAKNTASAVDIDYNTPDKLFSQQDSATKPDNNVDGVIIAAKAGKAGLFINTGGVFKVKTSGGAVYIQLIDICLDHAFGHSKEVVERNFFGKATNMNETIPEQIEQCVTSNWIDIESPFIIATTVLHADPVRSMCDFYNFPPGKLYISQDTMKRIVPSKYKSMLINETNTGYKIEKPPFGSDLIIEVLSERPAAKYIPNFHEIIKKHNEHVLTLVPSSTLNEKSYFSSLCNFLLALIFS
ncbi:hypothetical protein GAMM_60099 [Gammaproteobacteria bacterium]